MQARALTPRLLVEAARQSYISSYPGAFMAKLYYRIILIVLTVACGLGAVVTLSLIHI